MIRLNDISLIDLIFKQNLDAIIDLWTIKVKRVKFHINDQKKDINMHLINFLI